MRFLALTLLLIAGCSNAPTVWSADDPPSPTEMAESLGGCLECVQPSGVRGLKVCCDWPDCRAWRGTDTTTEKLFGCAVSTMDDELGETIVECANGGVWLYADSAAITIGGGTTPLSCDQWIAD